jgi:predicted MPP superfamily phosphohydrolase
MKKHYLYGSALFLVATLFSCSNSTVSNSSSNYVKSLPSYYDGFRVLQLTDIHWNFTTDMVKQSAYLTAVKNATTPDLIMITGDSTLTANEEIANTLYDLIDSWQIPYAFMWGNHDYQGTWNPSWLYQRASKGKYSLYTHIEDQVSGDSNYVINLMDGSKVAWQVYALDSNSYLYQKGLSYAYDYIRDDQVEWYKAQADKAKADNGGSYPASLMYFHIPLWEWVYAYEKNPKGSFGEIHEKSTYDVPGLADKIPFWPGDVHSGIFDAAASRGTKAFYCGHDHSNDWGDYYTSESGNKAYVGYGVKSGRELYYAKADAGYDMTGGALTILHDNGAFDLKHVFVNTDDVTDIRTEVLA